METVSKDLQETLENGDDEKVLELLLRDHCLKAVCSV